MQLVLCFFCFIRCVGSVARFSQHKLPRFAIDECCCRCTVVVLACLASSHPHPHPHMKSFFLVTRKCHMSPPVIRHRLARHIITHRLTSSRLTDRGTRRKSSSECLIFVAWHHHRLGASCWGHPSRARSCLSLSPDGATSLRSCDRGRTGAESKGEVSAQQCGGRVCICVCTMCVHVV